MGFYVYLERRSGNSMHEHHPKLYHPDSVPMPLRLLSKEQKENTINAMAATTDIGVGRNFLFRTTGRYFNTIKLAYLDRKEKGKDKTSDVIQCMIQNFQASDEIKFTTLSDVPVSELHNFDTSKTNAETLTISTTKDDAGSIINKSIEDDPLLAPISENAKKEQVCKKMLAAQYLFISIAWIVVPAFRFFHSLSGSNLV